MAPSANNNSPNDSRPTGDLEHLFRQKMGEAEVPPRQHVWEQLDHELLVRQNDAYRRRLLLHRWVAAACVLLVMACGSWLVLHNASHLPPSQEIAATTTLSASLPGSAETAGNSASGSGAVAAQEQTTSSKAAGSQAYARQSAPASSVAEGVAENLLSAARSAVGITRSESSLASTGSGRANDQSAAPTRVRGSVAETDQAIATIPMADNPTETQGANLLSARPLPTLAEQSAPASSMLRRPEAISPATLPASASMLAQTAVNAPQATPEEKPTERSRSKWRLSGALAAASYNPNMDFSSSGSSGRRSLDFNTGLANNAAPSAAARYQDAYQRGATQYRENLEAGPAQRVTITAAYALTKHWTLLTGIETAQQRASSQTSVALNDNMSAFAAQADANTSNSALAYLGQTKTEFTYRTAGVPVAIRYGSTKPGFSLYAKVGAAVNLLLKSRTELSDSTFAGRSYTLSSSDSPYRKVLTSVRGGGGVRYQPADATWSLALGPVAEAGLNTLNQNPGGSFFQRSRPYSVGLEASVEFGGQKAAAVAR